jgi:3-oxocholest-4-en-26-oyl-CoA dehydrogenase alpha subunit
MYIDYSDAERALVAELRAYFAVVVTDAVLAEVAGTEGGGPLYTKALRRMGADGWLGIGWPKEFGGQGRSAIEQYIFFDEVQRAGFPIPFLTLCTVGPTLIKYGTDEQKARAPVPTSLRFERAPYATATTTSSTARRCSPAWPSTPISSGSPSGRIPRPRATKAYPS